MNYHPLMTSPEIPWHNPECIDVPPPDGWRLMIRDEWLDRPFQKDEIGCWLAGWKLNPEANWRTTINLYWSYITNRPLPSKYAHLLEPDYSCPKYRASVEEAFRNGAAIEQCCTYWSSAFIAKCWHPLDYRGIKWENEWQYRIAPTQPAKDPAPDSDSDAHKLAVLMAAIDGAEVQFQRENGHWHRESSLNGLRYSISRDLKVRIAPKPEPVRVPLSSSEIPYPCWIRFQENSGNIIQSVVVTVGDSGVRIVNGEGKVIFKTFASLAESDAKKSQDGISWTDCFRLEEGGK